MCIINCQSICSLDKSYEHLNICASNSISFLFVIETFLNMNIINFEVFLGSPFKITARFDRDCCQHSGLLIALSSNSAVKVVDFIIFVAMVLALKISLENIFGRSTTNWLYSLLSAIAAKLEIPNCVFFPPLLSESVSCCDSLSQPMIARQIR